MSNYRHNHHNQQPQQQYYQNQQSQQPQQQHHHQPPPQQQQQQQYYQQQQPQLPQQSQAPQPTTYNAERIVGSGSFGVVYQARVVLPDGTPGEQVAIKRVYLDPEFKNRELQIMSELDHPSVVSLKHCFYTQHEGGRTYLNLVMPFLPDSIHRTIRAHSRGRVPIPLDRVRRYIYQIMRGLAYIHDLEICHRDLKPQNVLINEANSEVRVCDFGSAKKLSPTESNVSYICSRYYRAPELALGARKYTNAVDIWSAGCVFAELLTGKPLFPGETSDDQILRIISILGMPTASDYVGMGDVNIQEQHLRTIVLDALNRYRGGPNGNANNVPTEEYNNIDLDNLNISGQGLHAALALNPQQHLPQNNNNNNPLNSPIAPVPLMMQDTDVAVIQNDIANAVDLLACMLKFNPNERISAFKALAHPFFDKIHLPQFDDLPDQDASYWSWEIEQHRWTDREALLIREFGRHDRRIKEVLLPVWARNFISKRVQAIAQHDLGLLYEQRRQMQNMNRYPNNQNNAQQAGATLVFDPATRTYTITPSAPTQMPHYGAGNQQPQSAQYIQQQYQQPPAGYQYQQQQQRSMPMNPQPQQHNSNDDSAVVTADGVVGCDDDDDDDDNRIDDDYADDDDEQNDGSADKNDDAQGDEDEEQAASLDNSNNNNITTTNNDISRPRRVVQSTTTTQQENKANSVIDRAQYNEELKE